MTDPEERAPDPEALDRERKRRLRRFLLWAQAGGLVFLAVATLGLLPRIIASALPAAGPTVAVAVWVIAPALSIALLVVAAFRMRR